MHVLLSLKHQIMQYLLLDPWPLPILAFVNKDRWSKQNVIGRRRFNAIIHIWVQ